MTGKQSRNSATAYCVAVTKCGIGSNGVQTVKTKSCDKYTLNTTHKAGILFPNQR